MDFAFLSIGAFTNVSMAVSGTYYGGDSSRLRLVDEPYFSSGQVFEGFRSNWVLDSGIPYGYQPTNISGIYINNTFYPTNTSGAFSYHVDYPRGRVVFDTRIAANSIVKCEYTYRYINVSTDNTPWARTILFDSLRVDNPQFLQTASGIYSILAQSRVQLPAVIITPTNRVRFKGLELGGGNIRYQDVLMHVVSENPWDRNSISDILLNQKDKTIFLFDVNKVMDSGKYPLDYNGYAVAGGLLYPALVSDEWGFKKYRCTILDTSGDTYEEGRGLYRSVIRWTCEIFVPGV
jgi:hypothetical protein